GLAGDRPDADTSRRVLGAALWGREGSSRVRDTPVAGAAIIRSLDTGQAAYIYRGGVTFVQIKRLVAAPAALAGEPVATGQPPRPGERAARPAAPARRAGAPAPSPPPPDAGAVLDEAFGGEPG